MQQTTDIQFRRATFADVPQIQRVEIRAWGEETPNAEFVFRRCIELYPQGVILAVMNDTVIGYVVLFPRQYDFEKPIATWAEVTDNGKIEGVIDINSKLTYGVNLGVDPEYTNKGVGAQLIWATWKMVILDQNLQGNILGARMPEYHEHQDIPPEQYIYTRRPDGKLLDAELRFYEQFGYRVMGLLPDYYPDPESCNYGVLIYWENPDFDEEAK